MSIKNSFFILGSIILFGAIYMFVCGFLKPCGPTRGTDLSCELAQGMQASVDIPAHITVSSFHPFQVSYKFGEYVPQEIEPVSYGGFYIVEINSPGPVEIYGTKSNGGISTPTIRVDMVSDEYPTLTVTRTWNDSLIQLIHWYLFPVFVLYLIIAGSFFTAGFKL
jgi:hypothetical protein